MSVRIFLLLISLIWPSPFAKGDGGWDDLLNVPQFLYHGASGDIKPSCEYLAVVLDQGNLLCPIL